jgi:hypothetical protein
MRAFFETLNHFKDLLTLLLASMGGAFALWRWMVEQKWRRVQHAQSLIKTFHERPNTIKAFEIIDTEGDVEFSVQNTKKREVVDITDRFLIGALSTFDQQGGNTEKELIVRDILDDFFSDLSTFQSHIEADLIKLQDIRPYLEYWMRELTDRGRLRKHPFAEQTAKYLAFFGYNRVLALASNMGYPFPIPKQSHGETNHRQAG